MGIKGLAKVIGDHAARAMTEHPIESYFGRRIAVDASMSMYQFMIALRGTGQDLTSDSGDITSHISGMFYRTIRMVERGIRPCFVFDGKPPELKIHELSKRKDKLLASVEAQEAATAAGDREEEIKFSKRTVRVSREQADECKKLLRLMGMPVIEAPGEAEAQCAALARSGKVWAVGSEDMDTLTFGTPILLRNLSASEAQKKEIQQIELEKVLEDLGMPMEQFIDLCILLGCDYCDSIRGIGPKKAVQLLQEFGSIEKILEHLDTSKYSVPENWLFDEVRELFRAPDVLNTDEIELKWTAANEEELTKYMVEECRFDPGRVASGIARLKKATEQKGEQKRMDSFFQRMASSSSSTSHSPVSKKRSSETSGGEKKRKTGSSSFRGRK